jgi:transcription termination factor NusB
MLYQWEVTGAPMEKVVESFWRVRRSTSATRTMADRLANGARARADEIDAAIAEAASNWRLGRIAPVDRTILRLGGVLDAIRRQVRDGAAVAAGGKEPEEG